MHLGVKLPNWGTFAGAAAVQEVAAAAEQLGFHSLWVSDHVATPAVSSSVYPYGGAPGVIPWPPATPFLDSFLSLAWAAAVTQSVELATGVLVLPLQHPAVVARQAATLDTLSAGRLALGVGAGWLAEEYALVGRPFDRRGRLFDDAIETLRACWGPDPVLLETGDGTRAEFFVDPKPPDGAVPILVGGHAPPALRRAARVGDGWYAVGLDPEQLRELVGRLVEHAAAAGRERDRLRVGVKLPSGVEPDAALLARFAGAGADFVVCDLVDRPAAETVAALRRIRAAAGSPEPALRLRVRPAPPAGG